MLGWVAAVTLSAQTITLDTFDSDSATGAVITGSMPTSWVGNVTQNATSITVGGSARDENGWGANHVAIDASAMNYVRITGQLETGNVAQSIGVALADDNLYPDIFSVSTSAFVSGALTQVQIPLLSWINVSDPSAITGWSIGGGTTGLVAFRMTLADLSLSSELIPLSGGGRIVTAGDQVYTNPITLDAATTLGTTGSNGNAITFNTTIDGAQALTLNTPGTTTLAGAVGHGTALASLATDAGGTTAINGGEVTTTGTQTYGDDVTLGADTRLVSTAGSVNLQGTVTGNGHSLELDIAAASVFQSGSDLAGLIKSGGGTLTLAGESTFTGGITITAGTLELGQDNILGGANALILAGGTLATGGFDQTFDTLAVDDNSTLDFGADPSALNFANCQSIAWTSMVTILNFTVGEDSLRFGTSGSGLTLSQLSLINFGAGLTAVIDASGFVTGISAVPEPSAWAAMAGCLALVVALGRRQRREGRPG